MASYPVDAAGVADRLRGTRGAVALGIGGIVLGIGAAAFVLASPQRSVPLLVAAIVLALLSVGVLVRTAVGRRRLLAASGVHYAVTADGVAVPGGALVPWTSIRRVIAIDTAHQLQRGGTRGFGGRVAFGAGASVFGVVLVVDDGAAWRSRIGRVVTLGARDRATIDVQLDAFVGTGAARAALDETCESASRHGVPVVLVHTAAASASAALDALS